jgi:hypothetical protein
MSSDNNSRRKLQTMVGVITAHYSQSYSACGRCYHRTTYL